MREKVIVIPTKVGISYAKWSWPTKDLSYAAVVPDESRNLFPVFFCPWPLELAPLGNHPLGLTSETQMSRHAKSATYKPGLHPVMDLWIYTGSASTEISMFIDPVQLIDQTIDQLQTLAAHFEDETSERMPNASPLSPDAKRCKEALMTINVLIPKLRAARMARPMLNARQHRMCLNCED